MEGNLAGTLSRTYLILNSFCYILISFLNKETYMKLKKTNKVTHVNSRSQIGFIVGENEDSSILNVVWGCESYEEAMRYSRELSDPQPASNLILV